MSEKNTKSSRIKDGAHLTETDLAQQKMGNNQLQGNDQSQVRNQRHAVPDVTTRTDGIIESLEKTDKDVRAKRDLGKGNRYPPGHDYNKNDDNQDG